MFKFIAVVLCCCFFSVTAEDAALNNRKFPKDFSLGASTASYPTEGAWNKTGKGQSMWDWFLHDFPEKPYKGENGDVACDSYNKWREDIDLLKQLGVNHYKMSISWPRILPDGLANNLTVNQEAVAHYRNILEALVAANITPYVTLYHWDLPLPLSQLGGWQNPLLADRFAAYARMCFKLFGDLVKNWITISEPHTYCISGYVNGAHAPGLQIRGEGMYKCAHISLLAHAKAYHIYKDEFKAKQGGRVSIALSSPWYLPKSNSTKDKEAVQRVLDFTLGLFANPIFNGDWPARVKTVVDTRSKLEGFPRSRLPQFSDEEVKFIKGTADFFTISSYATYYAAHQNNYTDLINPDNVTFHLDQGVSRSSDSSWASDVDWNNMIPSGFRALLNYVNTKFGKPEILVSGNGWAENTSTAALNDQNRITYIGQYLSALLDAIYKDGVNVKGYTVRCLLDNLEWNHGYQQKYGLIQVDFNSANRTRTLKASFPWYKNVIQNRCLLDDASKCAN